MALKMKNQILFETQSELEALIENDLRSKPDHLSICLKIIRYICANETQDVQHLTIGSLSHLTEVTFDSILAESVQYLIGNRAYTLIKNFELIDEMDDTYPLSHSDVESAMNSGLLAHPVTGELVEHPTSKIYFYFSPSDAVQRIQAKR